MGILDVGHPGILRHAPQQPLWRVKVQWENGKHAWENANKTKLYQQKEQYEWIFHFFRSNGRIVNSLVSKILLGGSTIIKVRNNNLLSAFPYRYSLIRLSDWLSVASEWSVDCPVCPVCSPCLSGCLCIYRPHTTSQTGGTIGTHWTVE